MIAGDARVNRRTLRQLVLDFGDLRGEEIFIGVPFSGRQIASQPIAPRRTA